MSTKREDIQGAFRVARILTMTVMRASPAGGNSLAAIFSFEGDNGDQVLDEALKTNSTLTTLNLQNI
ncbi:hypothetical protein BGZ59_010358 [Podila verticillata]|nr:hypothetical protein BGZ59_010358 [Podila verticillata]